VDKTSVTRNYVLQGHSSLSGG